MSSSRVCARRASPTPTAGLVARRCSTHIRPTMQRIEMAEAWRAAQRRRSRYSVAASPRSTARKGRSRWKQPHRLPPAASRRPTIRSASTSSTPEGLSRWKIFVKWLLAIPQFIIVYLLQLVHGVHRLHRLLRDPVHEEVAARACSTSRSRSSAGPQRLRLRALLLRDEYPPFSGEAGRVSADARGRLRREPLALADLREVAAGDPAPVSCWCSWGSPPYVAVVHRVLRDPVHRVLPARLVRLRRRDGALGRRVQRVRVTGL